MAGKRPSERAQTQEERVCLMTRLGLLTNIRNYKRRAGSYTDGRTRTGQEGTQARHPQQQNILEDDTRDRGAHMGSVPSNSDPDGWTGPTASQQRGLGAGGRTGPRPSELLGEMEASGPVNTVQLMGGLEPPLLPGLSQWQRQPGLAFGFYTAPPPAQSPCPELPAPPVCPCKTGSHILLWGGKVGESQILLA